jgi:cellulose synthase/poly-beta-1,6-N-acetylglucosamine synthase-like glycosyltransferase
MPSVSIIIPVYNEQTHIRNLLEAIYAQNFPRSDIELIIADGMSTDGTRAQIADFSNSHQDIRIKVVDNLKRHIPAGLNSALKETRGDIIIRLDAHSIPFPDYIKGCVADLEAGLGENVGGVWEIRPGSMTWIAHSIAFAAAHPLGVGDALYRQTEKSAFVDTVPFGAFKRELLALVGLFDETLLTNEDYEFNARIRKSGGKIWLDSSIRSIYISRATLSGLAKQYFRYGYWKWRMLRRYPSTLRLRQALPPLFVFSLVVLGAAGLFIPLLGILFAVEIVVYILTLIFVGLQTAIKHRFFLLFFGTPLAIAIMHLSWGAGFLWSMISGFPTKTVLEKN